MAYRLYSYCSTAGIRASAVYSIRPSCTETPAGSSWLGRLIGRQSSNAQNTNNEDNNDNNGDGCGQTETEPHPLTEHEKLLLEKNELLMTKDKEIEQLKDKYVRALADTENTRTYMKRQINDAKLYGIKEFSKDILMVADFLEQAIKICQSGASTKDTIESLSDSLRMMDTELLQVFNKHGLERIDPLGQEFDTNYHEASFQIPGDKPGTVGVVSQVGYTLNGRTIRPALVGVVSENKTKD